MTQQRRYDRPGERPGIEQWWCVTCGLTLVTYRTSLGVVEDAEGLCIAVVNEKLGRGTGDAVRNEEGAVSDLAVSFDNARSRERVKMSDRLDLGDALGHLWEKLYVAFVDFDPSLGVAFRSYAVHTLRCRLIDWIRTQRGRDGRKAQANAAAIADLPTNGDGPGDDARLEHALDVRALDDPTHSLADLRRALVERRDELACFDPVRSHDRSGETSAR